MNSAAASPPLRASAFASACRCAGLRPLRDNATVRAMDDLRVAGFRFAGVRGGIKETGRDLALLVSDVPARAAGVMTRSTVVGAPVTLCRERLRRPWHRAIVVNSGCSNVAMGSRGERDARAMGRAAARAIGCEEDEVLIASTGIIGEPLPLAKIRAAIPEAASALRDDGLPDAAEAILTTDTRTKIAIRELRLGGRPVRIAGIAKGSGMIEPNMATMLSFLVTDAAVARPLLQRLLREAVGTSFNRVSVDGEGSTSDSVFLLANGAAGHPSIRERESAGARRFAGALRALCEELAREIARDGEGATKLVTVVVRGATSDAQAELAARRIANSLLVKTALFGGDPNWGRILQTLGAARVAIDLSKAQVHLGGVRVFGRGRGASPAERKRAALRLQNDEIEIAVDLKVASGRASMWTCDLSYDYVRINAEYHT